MSNEAAGNEANEVHYAILDGVKVDDLLPRAKTVLQNRSDELVERSNDGVELVRGGHTFERDLLLTFVGICKDLGSGARIHTGKAHLETKQAWAQIYEVEKARQIHDLCRDAGMPLDTPKADVPGWDGTVQTAYSKVKAVILKKGNSAAKILEYLGVDTDLNPLRDEDGNQIGGKGTLHKLYLKTLAGKKAGAAGGGMDWKNPTVKTIIAFLKKKMTEDTWTELAPDLQVAILAEVEDEADDEENEEWGEGYEDGNDEDGNDEDGNDED